MDYTLKVWRQDGPNDAGKFESIPAKDIPKEASFLEMLDIVNNQLEAEGKEPIAFDSDCREGICGTCGMVIDGHAHGEKKLVATCQLYMRDYPSGSSRPERCRSSSTTTAGRASAGRAGS